MEVIPGVANYQEQNYYYQEQQQAYPQYQEQPQEQTNYGHQEAQYEYQNANNQGQEFYYQVPQNNNNGIVNYNNQEAGLGVSEADKKIEEDVNSLPFDETPEIKITDDDLPFNLMSNQVTEYPTAKVNDQEVSVGVGAVTEDKEETKVDTEKYISDYYLSQINVMHEHRSRLNLVDNNLFTPVIREYLKDEKATIDMITEENIDGLNEHLAKMTS